MHAWEFTYGDYSDDGANSVAFTADRGYIVAGYSGSYGAVMKDVFVLKLNNYGMTTWSRIYGGTGTDIAKSIIPTPDGGYLFAGWTSSFRTYYWDAWVVKLNEVGDTVWTRVISSTRDVVANCAILASDSGYIVAGKMVTYESTNFWVAKLGPSGHLLWSRTYRGSAGIGCGAYSIAPTPDNGYIVAGYYTQLGPTDDIWILKLNDLGDSIWARSYNHGSGDNAYCITTTLDGGYIAAGVTHPSGTPYLDALVLRLNASGDTLWTRTYGGTGDDQAYSIIATSNGGYLLAGWTTSIADGNYDAWLLNINDEGNPQWIRTRGGEDNDVANSINFGPDGGYVVAGYKQRPGGGRQDVYVFTFDSLEALSVDPYSQELPWAGILFASHHADNLDLRIALPQSARVRLELLNSLGEHVATLADQALPAGESRLEVPCPKVPAGVYLIRSNGTLPGARVVVW